MDREERIQIVTELVTIDMIFTEHADDEYFHKTDMANNLRSQWLELYNKLASARRD